MFIVRFVYAFRIAMCFTYIGTYFPCDTHTKLRDITIFKENPAEENANTQNYHQTLVWLTPFCFIIFLRAYSR